MTPKKVTSKPAPASTDKASGASARKSTAVKKTASKTGASDRKIPTDEDISKKAHEIYLERIAKGEPGDSDSDWQKALDILNA